MPLQRPYSEIRASDAERERVVAFLREHALAGRLTHDELEERIGLAYAAVRVGDLERLMHDLPRPSAPRRHSSPSPPRHRTVASTPQRRPRSRQPCPALIIAGVALLLITGLPMVVMAGIIAVV